MNNSWQVCAFKRVCWVWPERLLRANVSEESEEKYNLAWGLMSAKQNRFTYYFFFFCHIPNWNLNLRTNCQIFWCMETPFGCGFGVRQSSNQFYTVVYTEVSSRYLAVRWNIQLLPRLSDLRIQGLRSTILATACNREIKKNLKNGHTSRID